MTDTVTIPNIELKSARLGYNNSDLLQDANLSISAGEICLIYGPNGSGKTTLGMTLVGILPLKSGERINHFHRIGYVPQVNRLDRQYPLALRDVVAMGLREVFTLNPWKRLTQERQVQEKVLHALSNVGLAEHARLHFSEASGGQLQRALIARALISEPDFILLDEPFSNLDQQGRKQVREILSRVNQEKKVALAIVDHLRDDEHFYQRYFLIQDGEVQETRGSGDR
ncbi:MAG: metal ABC transporter ATP-binding protein [Oligoflexus sp.]